MLQAGLGVRLLVHLVQVVLELPGAGVDLPPASALGAAAPVVRPGVNLVVVALEAELPPPAEEALKAAVAAGRPGGEAQAIVLVVQGGCNANKLSETLRCWLGGTKNVLDSR